MRRSTTALALLVALVPLAASCGDDDTSGSATTVDETNDEDTATTAEPDTTSALEASSGEPLDEENPVKVGVVAPLTGSASSPGNQHLDGVKAAVEYVNEHGGILGRKVELLVEDSAGDPVQSVARFKALVDQDIDVVFGDLLAGYAAMVPEFERADVISMSQATQDSIWNDPGLNPNGFNVFIPTSGYARLYVDYLVDNYGVTKIGVVGSTDAFAASMFESVEAYADELGLEVVTEQFDPNATDIANQLQALKDAGVDGLISATFAAGQIKSIQAQQALAWDIPTVTSNTLNTAAGVDAVKAAGLQNIVGGPVAKVMLVPEEGAPESEEAQTLLTNLEKVTGKSEFDGTWSNSLSWFDGLLVFKSASEAAGSTEAAEVKEVLESGDPFDGLAGEFVFSPDYHVTQNVDDIFGLYLGGLPCPRTCVAAPGQL